jgi:hypothetical protein
MHEHFEAVEADFQSHYGLDLRDVLWGPRPFGVRRVHALVNGLPIQGALFRTAITNGRSWTTTDELLATLIEITDHGNNMYYSTHSKPAAEKWKPIEIHRPTDKIEPAPDRQATPAEMWEAFEHQVIYETSEAS